MSMSMRHPRPAMMLLLIVAIGATSIVDASHGWSPAASMGTPRVGHTATTAVTAGAETANAKTNSRQVCDTAGNCSTAGPIGGNRVDRKAPAITIASPAAGAAYGVSTKVAASYAC